jgi:hypothetical protein
LRICPRVLAAHARQAHPRTSNLQARWSIGHTTPPGVGDDELVEHDIDERLLEDDLAVIVPAATQLQQDGMPGPGSVGASR